MHANNKQIRMLINSLALDSVKKQIYCNIMAAA